MSQERCTTPQCDALARDPFDSNDMSAWHSLAYRLEKKLSALQSETARSEGYPGIAHDLETMRTALRSIAIVDDADCAHASDPEAMKKIARDALRGVK